MKIRYRDDGQRIVKEVVLQYISRKEFKTYLTKKEFERIKKDEYYSLMEGHYKTKKLSSKEYNQDVECMNKSGRVLITSAKNAFDFWYRNDFVILDF